MGGQQVAQAASGTGGLSYGVSVSLSRSTSLTTGQQAVGSSVLGAGDVNIVATGGGQDSNILASGAAISAGRNANLSADNAITLQASQDTSRTVGQNSSSGASVGVTFGAGAQTGLSIQLSMTNNGHLITAGNLQEAGTTDTSSADAEMSGRNTAI